MEIKIASVSIDSKHDSILDFINNKGLSITSIKDKAEIKDDPLIGIKESISYDNLTKNQKIALIKERYRLRHGKGKRKKKK